MVRFGSMVACALAMIALSLPSSAGDKKKEDPGVPEIKRGPEYKVLESLVGTFDAKIKLFLDPAKPPTESAGTMTRTMILDGNFMQESFKGTFFGKPFSGLGVVGYDSMKKQYVSNWCDSMSTTMTLFHGTYDAEKKTLTSVGTDYTEGKKIKARDILRIINDDEQHFEMFRQPEDVDKEFRVMEITYKRAKPPVK